MAHPKNEYLLRRLVKCSLCGLTYMGSAVTRANGKREFHYRCNGRQVGRGPFGEQGQRCRNPSVPGRELEAAVWNAVAGFIHKPGEVLKQLEQQMTAGQDGGRAIKDRIAELEAAQKN